MAIALAQAIVTSTATATPGAPQISATLASTPTVGNLLVAKINGALGPWTLPTGWTVAAGGGANLSVYICYRQVVAGDGKTYTFSEGGITTSDTLEMELKEMGGFAAGVISVDRHASIDTGIATTASISPGSTTVANELVEVAIGVASASAINWTTQGISTDTSFLGSQLATGHVVLTATQSLNPITATWTTAHSSTLAVASFAVIPLTPVLAQSTVQGTTGSASTTARTLGATPTVGNLLLATAVGLGTSWTAPAGWLTAAVSPAGSNCAIAVFYKRVVSGDTAGPYTFTMAGGPTIVGSELKEITGLPGTAVSELIVAVNTASGTTATANLGTTAQSVEFAHAVLAAPGTTSGGAWNLSFTLETSLTSNIFTSAYRVTSSPTALNGINPTWTGAAVSTLLAVSFAFVPYQAAVCVVYRGLTGFDLAQPSANAGTTVTGAAAGAPTNTNTITPASVNAMLIAFAATINTNPQPASPEATTIVGGTQRAAITSGNAGLAPSVAVNDLVLPTPAATTWTYAGNNAYTGSAELVAMATVPSAPQQPNPPTGVTATGGSGQAVLTWTIPTNNGGAQIIDYTAVASPGGVSAVVSGAASAGVTVTGLTAGSYSFVVTARNTFGPSARSVASNTVVVT